MSIRRLFISITSLFFLAWVVLTIPSSGQVIDQPEILVSTNSFGDGWQILAINPDTGDFRNVSDYPADN